MQNNSPEPDKVSPFQLDQNMKIDSGGAGNDYGTPHWRSRSEYRALPGSTLNINIAGRLPHLMFP